MLPHLSLAMVLVVIAGVINGSFALFTKHVGKWRFENIWLNYALWAFLVLPWVSMWIMAPQVMSIYEHAPMHIVIIMLVGGFLFGLGQVCFALAMNHIGLGLSFVINIGLGTALGFFLPLAVQHPEQIMTPFGLATLLGTAIIVAGLLFSYVAGQQRDKQYGATQTKGKHYGFYVLLAVIAGLFSAGQNFTFSLTGELQTLAVQMGVAPLPASIIMWPGFLTCSFLPYIFYMLALHVKHDSFDQYRQSGTAHYYLFALLMGLFWYGSLILYSKASQLIGHLGPVVGWPMFMVLIILSSNFWGWRHGEWRDCQSRTKRAMLTGVLLLVVAVLVLAYSTHLSA